MEKLSMKVSEKAAEMLKAAVAGDEFAGHAVRLVARRAGQIRFRYHMGLESPADGREEDFVLEIEDLKLRADPDSAFILNDVSLEYVEDGVGGSGFKFHHPDEDKGWDDPVAQRLQELLDSEINPSIASHGGYIDLLDYKEGKAYVGMGGGCQGCGMARVTLRQGVETRVRELIPEITEIIDETDHSAGHTPYQRQE